MGTDLLGRRRDGRPIYLIRGAADGAPDGGAPGNPPAGQPNPPAPTPPPAPAQPPAPSPDDTAALRAELAAAKAEAQQNAERLRALMAGDTPPAAPQGDDDGDDDAQDDKDGPKPTDPEMAKLQRALRAVNRESKARREAADKLRADWEAQDKARQAQLAEAQRLSEAADKARQEAEARYKPATIKAAAVPALLAAGAKPERADKLVRLLDQNALDVDAAGEVTGLVQQIAAVKADYPELFAPAEAPRPTVPRVTGGDRPPAEQPPSRSADLIARQVLGGAA